ncbi:hypothetical protein [Mycolicibacterium alvei]|uniref:hypothetical protein n=1 Tax=Mycolicibacterium alvei TaxID=67081 RepID=UPI0021F38A48|nr:hypothetical protein [Mycolicibacterium alvei]MCV6999469.1 hypothetical protein [Mycolicibacterium alvei]
MAKKQNSNQKNPIKTKDTNKLASKKQNHTLNGKKSMAKNNKQKPPNTLLSSQTTRPSLPRRNPAAKSR